jgi:hypothetical protein
VPLTCPALLRIALTLALTLTVLRPESAHAGARHVAIWIWAEGEHVGVRFDEPLLHTWRLPRAPSPAALAPLLADPDLARLERTARLALRIEDEALRDVAETLQRALGDAGFTDLVIKPWRLGADFKRLPALPALGRSRSDIRLRARPAEDAAAAEVVVEARLHLRFCEVVPVMGPGGSGAGERSASERDWTEHCRLERTWRLPVEADGDAFSGVASFLGRAFRSRPIILRARPGVDEGWSRRLIAHLEEAGFRWVKLQQEKPWTATNTRSAGSRAWRRAWRSRGAARGGLLVGLGYSTGLRRSTLGGWLYPSVGWSYDWEGVHIDGITPFPWAFLDFLGGVVGWAAGRGDLVLPIAEGLNGGEAGWAEIFTFRGRYALAADDGHKLDLGLLADLHGVGPTVHDRDPSLIVFSTGLSLGYGFHARRVAMNLALDLGDGFHQLGAWSPFAGAALLVRVPFGDLSGWYLRLRLRAQRFSYHDYEPSGLDAPEPELFDFSRWEGMLGVETGFFFNVLDP